MGAGSVERERAQALGERARREEVVEPARGEARGPALAQRRAPTAERQGLGPGSRRARGERRCRRGGAAGERAEGGGTLDGDLERVRVGAEEARGLGAALGEEPRGVVDRAGAARERAREDAPPGRVGLAEHAERAARAGTP